MDAENQRDNSTPRDASAEQEGGYGSPTPEEEMPQASRGGNPEEASGEPTSGPDGNEVGAPANEDGGESTPAPESSAAASGGAPEEAPSTEADIDEGNTEDHAERESFSSESDADGSGLPDGGSSD